LKNVVIPTRFSHLTQGALFTCAKAEGYTGCEVHGLIITARCDAEHDKVPVHNYIPVVRFADWLSRDFVRIACGRDTAQLEANFATTLKSVSMSASILLTQSPRSILAKLFDNKENTSRPQGSNLKNMLSSGRFYKT
jgi:hypothetical protein